MTREEAIKQYIMPALKRTWKDDRCIEIISAIEQEPTCTVLEQIRTEVESINPWALRYAPAEDKDARPQIVAHVKNHVLEIIDKHTAESEDKQ